jgi:hypothetical protein
MQNSLAALAFLLSSSTRASTVAVNPAEDSASAIAAKASSKVP